MVRAIDSDFEQLCGYLESYSLANLGKNPDSRPCIRIGHRLYLSLLTAWARSHHMAQKGELNIGDAKITVDGDHLQFFREFVADVGSGLFCCLQGAYKPAHMALRSGIENFLRFSCGAFNSKALTSTSVYELFDLSKATPFFGGESKKSLVALRTSYVELCKYTHSASLQHMTGIHALAQLPTFDGEAFSKWNDLARIVCTSAIGSLCMSNAEIYTKAHYRSQDVMDCIILTATRRKLLAGV